MCTRNVNWSRHTPAALRKARYRSISIGSLLIKELRRDLVVGVSELSQLPRGGTQFRFGHVLTPWFWSRFGNARTRV
jgi:hypothetical protein